MLKNQGFIYLTASSLDQAPLIKINHFFGPTMPEEVQQKQTLLALWHIKGEEADYALHCIKQLHCTLIRAGLAFTTPQTYQCRLTSLVHFIDAWLAYDRHLDGMEHIELFDQYNLPTHTHYASEATINLSALGHAWLNQDDDFSEVATACFYRGMINAQADCQYELARCYQNGQGIEHDYARAGELFETLQQYRSYPALLELHYLTKKIAGREKACERFFDHASLPLPGKGEAHKPFYETLLNMLQISFKYEQNLNLWFKHWEIIYPYKEELLTLLEGQLLDLLDGSSTFQIQEFHAMLNHAFLTYRQSA